MRYQGEDKRLPGDGRVRRVTPEMQAAARALRRRMTPAETTLWAALRGGQVAGLRFRRQHAVGTFVLDFYCPAARLALEVDGKIHTRQDVAEHDALRQQGIENHEVRVLRLRNDEIETDLETVLEKIREAASQADSVERKPFSVKDFSASQKTGKITGSFL